MDSLESKNEMRPWPLETQKFDRSYCATLINLVYDCENTSLTGETGPLGSIVTLKAMPLLTQLRRFLSRAMTTLS